MKKRIRLSKKQTWFFINIFIAGQTVSQTLQNLHIRRRTFDRWLTKPLFLEHLQMHINHYYFETRIELARNAPQAVSGLSFLGEKSLRHKEVRQACNDLLKLHSQYTRPVPSEPEGPPSKVEGRKKAQNGVVSDNFGVSWEQFGVVLDNNGVIKDKFGNTNTPQNRIFDTENAENTEFPRLIPSKARPLPRGPAPSLKVNLDTVQ